MRYKFYTWQIEKSPNLDERSKYTFFCFNYTEKTFYIFENIKSYKLNIKLNVFLRVFYFWKRINIHNNNNPYSKLNFCSLNF